MKPVTNSLKEAGADLLEGVAAFLGAHLPLRDINTPSSALLFVGPHYAFDELPLEKKRVQSRLIDDHRHFVAITRALLRGQAEEVRRKVDQNDQAVQEVIEQTHCVWHATTDKALAAVKAAIENTLETVECLYDPTEGSVALVPDTNALIYSSTFHAWGFAEIPEFELILVPNLLSELDSLIIRTTIAILRCGPRLRA